jgi:transposase
MVRVQKEPLRAVTAAERAALERLSKASSARVDRVRRATALLVVADGGSFAAAARAAGLRSGPGVAGVVRRFNQRGLGAVAIAPGRGRRATYGTAERARIVAAAQRAPDRRRDGTGAWSLSTLERSLRREGLTRLGATTIRRVLADAGSSYQKTRTWCPTGTAERTRKAGIVRVVDPQTEQKRA